ncbi:STAS domain-containing protein [Streptomyces koyangensis]
MKPHGRLTEQMVADLRQRLLHALAKGPEVLEVDLSQVTYLAPGCCGALLAAAAVAPQVDARLAVTHPNARTRITLLQHGLGDLIDDGVAPPL